jgi:pimeloyl-ACP methyl ester carboxylesterase
VTAPNRSPSIGSRTLVLLPGLLCDDEVWSAQRAALADRCEVLIGGYGDLDRLDRMARHVLDQVTAPRFALAGHSMGGRVALEVMRLAPDRVSHLALLDTGTASLDTGSAGADERRGRSELLALARRAGMATMARQWAPPMVHPDAAASPLFERIVAMVERSNPARFEAQIEALLHRPDAADVLRAVRCPLLLLCGRDDRWSPPARHEAMQALVAGSTLFLVEHCGHMSPMEQPQAVSEALAQWLAREVDDGR